MTTRLLLRLALLVLLAGQVLWVLEAYGSRPFVYVLDDPYIHLTLARNLATTGVLGVNPGQWSSASSSPAWTALLAGVYLVLGNQVLAPLALNLLIAGGLVWWLVGFFQREGYEPLLVLLIGAVFVMLVPLVPLAFTGMEHLLHLALILALVITTVGAVEGRTHPAWPIGLALVATTVRYETLFVIAGLAFCLLLRRRWGLALGMVAAGLGVVAAVAAVSVAHGESPLPNTFLVKALSAVPGESVLTARLLRFARNLLDAEGLALLAVLGAGAIPGMRKYWAQHPPPAPPSALWTVGFGGFALATLLHLTLASVGWFFRYEAYLIGLGFILWMWALPQAGAGRLTAGAPSPWLRVLLVGVVVAVALPVLLPGSPSRLEALGAVPLGMGEVYRQQYQMARFVREYYNGSVVGLNDVGAVSYYSQAHIVDLVGLASYPLAAARARGPVTAESIDRFARAEGVRVALVYTDWFRHGPPATWRLVGTWTTPGAHISVGGETIGFYALSEPAETLGRHLRDFTPTLPAEVNVSLNDNPG